MNNLKNRTITEICTRPIDNTFILLVDDDTCATIARKAILELMLPCTVRAVPQARAALGELISLRFDLVILDYHMPEMNGFQLACMIRDRWPAMPMMMLSGDSAVPEEAKGAVDEFVEKGWPPEIFIAAVSRLLATQL